MFVTQYEMNIITQNSSVTPMTTLLNQTSYAPATSDQLTLGNNWYSTADQNWLNINSLADAANKINTSIS